MYVCMYVGQHDSSLWKEDERDGTSVCIYVGMQIQCVDIIM